MGVFCLVWNGDEEVMMMKMMRSRGYGSRTRMLGITNVDNVGVDSPSAIFIGEMGAALLLRCHLFIILFIFHIFSGSSLTLLLSGSCSPPSPPLPSCSPPSPPSPNHAVHPSSPYIMVSYFYQIPHPLPVLTPSMSSHSKHQPLNHPNLFLDAIFSTSCQMPHPGNNQSSGVESRIRRQRRVGDQGGQVYATY